MERSHAIDLIRGTAIALMVFDHAIVAFDLDPQWRHLTRVAMPMFMIVSGWLFCGSLTARYWQVWAAAALTWPFVLMLDVAVVHVLLVFALVYPLLLLPLPWLVCLAGLGLLQVYNWPLNWGGYQPGYVLAFLVVGRLSRLAGMNFPRITLPALVTAPGRYPLTLYTAHLIGLFLLTQQGA